MRYWIITPAVVLASIALVLVTRARPTAMPQESPRDYKQLDRDLLTAVHNGVHAEVEQLLDLGADANARTEGNDTALMQALLNSDTAMAKLLLDNGADPNARGVYDVTPLLRAVHDREKVEVLLSHGTRIDERVMVIAAMVGGSRPTLEMLVARGGNVNAAVGGFTPLMAAAYAGDLESTTWLIEHGANVNDRTEAGCTALNGAAVAGSAGIIELLLARGANPNVRYEEPNTIGDFQTPALNAAWQGRPDCLKPLLEHGADINLQGGPFNRAALLCAATSGSEETIRLLLNNKANVRAQDWQKESALDWARRRGDTTIVKLLADAGGTIHSTEQSGSHRQELLASDRKPNTVQSALTASLPLLQRSGQKISQSKGCITCHQHSLVAMTIGLARKRGVAVNEEIASSERHQVTTFLGKRYPMLLLGAELDPTLAAYTLAGFAAEDQPADAISDALVHYLVLHQRQEGFWQPEAYRPPDDGSSFLFTALAVRGLQVYAPPGRRSEIASRITRARHWLETGSPKETVDKVFQLLGLHWADAPRPELHRVADVFLGEQRADGGWAQLPTLSSDAHATGQALFALHEAIGLPADAPAYRRGVEFLLKTQQADGSWFVSTRCFPVLEYSSSGFPHGRSQFISASATCWASMALCLTLEP